MPSIFPLVVAESVPNSVDSIYRSLNYIFSCLIIQPSGNYGFPKSASNYSAELFGRSYPAIPILITMGNRTRGEMKPKGFEHLSIIYRLLISSAQELKYTILRASSMLTPSCRTELFEGEPATACDTGIVVLSHSLGSISGKNSCVAFRV